MESSDLPFNSERFKSAWDEWLTYRKERRLAKYVPTGLKKTLSALFRESGENEDEAIDIIINSMEKNYQGLFKRKQNGNSQTHQNPVERIGTSQARTDAARKF